MNCIFLCIPNKKITAYGFYTTLGWLNNERIFIFWDYSFKCACVEHTTILIYEFVIYGCGWQFLYKIAGKCFKQMFRLEKKNKFYCFISLSFVILNLRGCVSLHMEQLGSDSNSQTCLTGSLELFGNREITQRPNLITNLTMVSTECNICSTYSRGLCFKQQHFPKDSFIRFIE